MFRSALMFALVIAAFLTSGLNLPNAALSSSDPLDDSPGKLVQVSTSVENPQPNNQTFSSIPSVPTFTWGAIAGATQYRVYLRDVPTKTVTLDQTLDAASICNQSQCSLPSAGYLPAWGLTNAIYEWWLGTSVPGASRSWSQAINFTVTVPPPAVPANLHVDPGEGRITITFDDDPNTFWVRVWIGPHPDGNYDQWHGKNTGAKPYSCAGGTCTIRPVWDRSAKDGLNVWMRSWGPGISSGSPEWVNVPLTLPSTPPVAPANLSPSGAFQPGQVSTVSWSASNNAIWYQLLIATSQRTVYKKWFLGEDIGCPSDPGTCTVTDPALANLLIPSIYTMYIRAWGLGGFSVNGNASNSQWNKAPLQIYCPSPTTLDDRLKWAPPTLVNPITINVSLQGGLIDMDDNEDYRIQMPNQPVQGALKINGGRNVVLIGGEIYIPWQGANAYIRSRTGVTIYDVKGTLHIEGLKISGPDLTEGFQIDAPNATIQLENILVENIHARDEINFSDNHPDLIQPWGGYKELRVDRFTGSSDYQGIFLKPDFGSLGPAYLNRVNLVGLPTARYLFWADIGTFPGPVTLNDVWVDAPPQRQGGFGNAIWPPAQGKYPNQAQFSTDNQGNTCAVWPPQMVPRVNGAVFDGIPPAGPFASQTVGSGYVLPGYQGQ